MAKAQIVSESEVMAVPAVQPTKSWNPIHHGLVIQAVSQQLARVGITVKQRSYSMSQNGMDLFGSWILDQGANGMDWSVGFRNSMQKNFAVGICAGDHVLVCSNMCFSGEFIEFRKHTSGLDLDELHAVTARAIDGVIVRCQDFQNWHQKLHEIELPSVHRKVMTFNAMERGVLPPSQFNALNEAYEMEKELNGDTVYSFHGAHTRVLKDASLFQVSDRTKKLSGLVNEYAEAVGFNF